MNKAVLTGRITKDIELRYTNNNIATTTFTIAVNRTYTNQNGERDADFINCVAWRNQAENLSKYCTKGSLVGVEGTIQTRTYEKQDGTKQYITEIIADRVEFLESKKDASATATTTPAPQKESNPFADFGEQIELNADDLDLPF